MPRILREYRDGTLNGADRTYQRIASRFYLPDMIRMIFDYVEKYIDLMIEVLYIKSAGQFGLL